MVGLAVLLAVVSVVFATVAVRRARAMVRESHASLRSLDAVLDFAPVGVAVLDRELRFVRANQALSRIGGQPSDALLGKLFDEVTRRPDLGVIARSVLSTGTPAFGLDASGTSQEGRTFRAVVDFYPVRIDGAIIGVGVIVHDITATARVDDQRRRLLDRLGELQRITEALARARSTEDVVRAVVDDISDSTWAVSATLMVWEGDELRVVGTSYDREQVELALAAMTTEDDRPVLEAMRERRIIIAGPDEIAARWPVISAGLADGESIAALPLVDDDTVLGGLVLRLRAPGGRSTRDEVFLTAIGTQTAEALRRVTVQAEGEAATSRLSYLAAASDAFSSTLDWRRTLRRVAEIAVPRLADIAAAFVVNGPEILEVEIASAVARQDTIRALVSGWPRALETGAGAAALFHDRRPILITDLSAATTRDGARSATAPLAEAGFRSLIAVPMTADDRVVGFLVLASDEPRQLGEDDVELALEIAGRAGQAILNAERFEERSHVADTLQASLLPTATPAVPGVEVATRFFAVGEGIDVGGDFYDVFRMGTALAPDDRWAIVIGDVRGKGPEAASISGAARHAIRAAALHERSPAKILGQLNELLMMTGEDEPEPRFCTAVLAVIEPGHASARVTLSVAGHPPPMILRSHGVTETVAAQGTLLGVVDQAELEDVELDLCAGDALVLYTDGVTERHAGTRFFDEDAFASVLSRCTGFTAPVLAERIETASRAFVEDLPRDDLAIVVVRVPEAVASASAASTDLPNDVSAPTLGRRFIAAALDALALDIHAETAALLASELVTNALVHADGPYRISIESGEGVLRIGVTDGTTAGPQLSPDDMHATSGRGMRMIEALTDRWGVHLGEGGKTVWFELDT
jgi:PAS domain S-box-containing protein